VMIVVLHQKKYPYIIFNGKDLRLQADNTLCFLSFSSHSERYFVLLRITSYYLGAICNVDGLR